MRHAVTYRPPLFLAAVFACTGQQPPAAADVIRWREGGPTR